MLANLNKKLAVSYLWNLLSKWLNRSIGFISTLCLVRLLEPNDFGVVALANIVLAFFVMISDAGTNKYLIRAQVCSDEMLNSAWSLNIVLKALCGIAVAASSSLIAKFMGEPLLYHVLLVSSLLPIISSLKNIGLVLYERDLNYKPLTQLAVSIKIVTLPITLVLAVYINSYWALIIGLVSSEVFTVFASYRMHSYRPRWSTVLWGKQWFFSQWHLISMTTGYIRSRIDAVLLGRYLTSTDVGIYRVSQEFAWLPFTELISPATAAMYSGLTHVRDDKEELQRNILRYLAMSYMLIVPSVFGLYTLQELFTTVVLGEKWSDAAPIIGLLSILMLSMPLNISLQSVLTSLSKLKYLVSLDAIMIAVIAGVIGWLTSKNTFELLDYTEFRVSLVALFILLLSITYKRVINLSVIRVLITLCLPALPAMVMVNILNMIRASIPYSEMVSFFVLILIGTIIFVPLMLALMMFARLWLEEYDFIINVLRKLKNVRKEVSN